jgi:hypothetical protein
VIVAGLSCGILTGVKEPRFTEMNKVRVDSGKGEPYEGYVIAVLFKDDRWIYKLSVVDPDRTGETFDNWVPEEWCELTK